MELHRDVRLRALRESPTSFGEAFEDAAARPSAYWEELTQSVTEPGGQVMFLAWEDAQLIGSAYGLLDRERTETGRVGGMWVEPAWRRRGVGAALLQEVFDWARSRGLKQLALWAPNANPAAIALYKRAGFRETGERRPLSAGASHWIVAMQAEL